jgi:DNA-directed RNA polymerase specialized sigma24 family protein
MDSSVNKSAASASASLWMDMVRAGNPGAQEKVWEQFFPQLVALARQRLAGARMAEGDEEDVALSVLNSFFAGAAENRFPDLRGSDNLWRLLSWMTHRKVIDWLGHHGRQKRQAVGESALQHFPGSTPNGMAQVADPNPSPDLEVILIDELRRLVRLLPDNMQTVATLKMDGFSNLEIAEHLGCSLATVERRLKMIREIWKAASDESQVERSVERPDPA